VKRAFPSTGLLGSGPLDRLRRRATESHSDAFRQGAADTALRYARQRPREIRMIDQRTELSNAGSCLRCLTQEPSHNVPPHPAGRNPARTLYREVPEVTRFLVVLLATFAWMNYAVAESDPFQFNGLPWGSSVAQIKAKFPGKTRPFCVDPKHESYPCGKLIVEPYVVAGIPFRLELEVGMGFNGEPIELAEIRLLHNDNYAKHTPSESAWVATCENLATALTARYGKAVSDRSDSSDHESRKSRFARWQLADTEIHLLCTYSYNGAEYKTFAPFTADYSVGYKRSRPRLNEDARRL
jgi:hypothetical protein